MLLGHDHRSPIVAGRVIATRRLRGTNEVVALPAEIIAGRVRSTDRMMIQVKVYPPGAAEWGNDGEAMPAPVFSAIGMTLWLTLWAGLWSLVIGTFVAILRLAPIKVLQWAGATYVMLFRNTPLTLIIVSCNFVLWIQLGLELRLTGK